MVSKLQFMGFGRRHSSPAGSPAFRRANGLSEESSGGMAPERNI